MSQFVYDLVHIIDDDGTANLLTVKDMEIPVEIKNLCNILGFEANYSDHTGWKPNHLIASVVEQCPALGIRVRQIHLNTYRLFAKTVEGEERAIRLCLEGCALEKHIA